MTVNYVPQVVAPVVDGTPPSTQRIGSLDALASTTFAAEAYPSIQAAVTAPVGSLFLRTDGGAGTTLYVKQSGTGNTGWAAK